MDKKTLKQEEKAGRPLACCSRDSDSSISTAEGVNAITKNATDPFPQDPPFGDKLDQNQNQMLLQEYKFFKRRPVDIEFKNIKFSVREYKLMKLECKKREILHGVEGHFKSGELTAIMGPSGAGKSTLLNILAGYTSSGVTGTVLVNGTVRDPNTPQRFRRLSRYIQQDDDLRSYLTAGEAMTVAAHLKLGYSFSDEHKSKQVDDTLAMLGLEECHNTLTGKLSGGQRKRLAIALELLSNPPVLFLDEPTTGLDSSSCSQCVALLKRLSQEGRTVICTIHQPSALLFDMFDKLYALANGFCIYRGPAKQLVPFLSHQGLNCPPFHNPADFLIEVAIGEHDVDLALLSDAASKAAEESKSNIARNSFIQDSNDLELHTLHSDADGSLNTKDSSVSSSSDDVIFEQNYPPANLLRQTWLLFKRNCLTARRNYSLLLYRLVAHVLIGLLFGYLYHNVGQNAETVLANYVYLYGTLLLVVYTGKMSVTLAFPLEMNILRREHFNKWYNLGPYLISTLALEIPFQIICVISYISISYIMTGNRLVEFRILYFFVITIATSLCGQSWGYFIGATTPVKIAVFIGPVLAVLFSVFGFCIRLVDTPVIFQWLFHTSYFRAGFHSLVYSVYGLAREKLDCLGEGLKYCHYRTPDKFLREMDIIDIDIWGNLGLVISLGVIMHFATAGALWCRLNRR